MPARTRSRLARLTCRPEEGSAVVDFSLVTVLLCLVFVAVVQLGVALHVRNTLIWCASEGARLGARSGSDPADGVARTRDLITSSVSAGYARDVTAVRRTVGGVRVVEVRVHAPLPVLALAGPGGALDVSGRAFEEDQ